MVALIATYLFDHSVHVSDIYNRPEDSTIQYWTLPYVPGDRLASTPAFVLASGRTFFGVEDFTYNPQAIKRATVIGETTGTGAHPTMFQAVDGILVWACPLRARSISPRKQTGSGTGVTPDVQLKSTEALQAAHRLAVNKIRAQSTSNRRSRNATVLGAREHVRGGRSRRNQLCGNTIRKLTVASSVSGLRG
jgi:C-terminal processing protease CtpA/Prc